ncbi:MAG: YfhO family protein [Firmicutes bacterium]|nr:YfhO family protein [Bacillota bacterium]
MLAILYLLTGWLTGYRLIRKFLPQLFKVGNRKSLYDDKIPLEHWMVTLPASFLIGTLVITWVTYLAAYCFRNTATPLSYGNLVSLSVFLAVNLYLIVPKGRAYFAKLKSIGLSGAAEFYRTHRRETLFILIVLLVSSFMMFYTFHINNGRIYVGLSVFSDFGPHLAVIRSFSHGMNFPTEYPHFANGQARYHFLFQFLSGNLEYLGLPIDWAFNLPSIISLTVFMMLLYALAVILTGKPGVGFLSVILFFFRSSMAFFTYWSELRRTPGDNIFARILRTDIFIGKTLHEDWGLWAQNVYVNQRHFAFALGIMLIIIIVLLPLFKKMLHALREKSATTGSVDDLLQEFMLRSDAWLPADIGRSVVIGVLLGLLSFWNGAVVVAALLILFGLAVFSKHRLEFANIALIAIAVSYLETLFFIGPGSSALQPQIMIGFLAAQKDGAGILRFYLELLGLLPLVLLTAFCFAPGGGRWLFIPFLLPLIFATTVQLTPDIAMNHKFIIISVLLLNIFAADFIHRLFKINPGSFKFNKGKNQADSEPALETASTGEPVCGETASDGTDPFASGLRFIGKISLAALNKFESFWNLTLTQAIIRAVLRYAAFIILMAMTITGVVDFITLINKNLPQKAIVLEVDDPVTQWVEENTRPDDLFLTDAYCIHPILMAGRKIFYGWPYFAWSAGYDVDGRNVITSNIYGGYDLQIVKELLEENQIRYVVIEDGNRQSYEYRLNEDLFRDNFTLVYQNEERRIDIYKVD